MMGSKKYISIIIIISIVSGLIGVFIGSYATSRFFVKTHYSSIKSDLIYEVSVLNHLRENNYKDAIDLLESKLDSNLIALNTEASLTEEDKGKINNILSQVAEYRKKYNIKNQNPEVEQTIQDILKAY